MIHVQFLNSEHAEFPLFCYNLFIVYKSKEQTVLSSILLF